MEGIAIEKDNGGDEFVFRLRSTFCWLLRSEFRYALATAPYMPQK